MWERRRAVNLVAPAGCALILALTGCGGSAQPSRPTGSAYTLMQMNLCLSGIAGCYRRVEYPAVLNEAIARIRQERPDVVTFNESCSADVTRIARRTGYQLRFSRTIYHGNVLPCIRPRGRGLFGDAVLTKAAIEGATTGPFRSQAGPERRGWLCVKTRIGVQVCTAHLASPERAEVAANSPQCAELMALLHRRATAGPVIFGGDVNRLPSCAPPGFWTRSDTAGHQDPGRQQAYGSAAFQSPAARTVPAVHTDHGVLLVSARYVHH